MTRRLTNWKIQIRKGYLDLCILRLVKKNRKVYGFELLEKLKEIDLPLKEGTLYPLLNRMTQENVLSATWQTEGNRGHPRKFYSLTDNGINELENMNFEFKKLTDIYYALQER